MDMQSKVNHQDEYGYNNDAISDRIIINWSPPENYNYICKRRFGSPRVLSKSVPRKNRNFIQYRINRSLNFDITGVRSPFKSPDKSLDDSIEGINLLSRSAKIMKALNLNHTLNSKSKSIKKSLNFDTTPNAKRFANKSPKTTSLSSSFNTPLSRLSRTLNFDSSPSDSSVMLSSVESIDENQNQTPSHMGDDMDDQYYMTPNYKSQSRSPHFNLNSQTLRSGLKEQIDRIVQIGATPNICSSTRNKIQMKHLNSNPARNLLNDFQEIDNDDYHNGNNDNNRPSTPENSFLVVAESTNAIKKSHKKERLSGRFNHLPLQADDSRRTSFSITSQQPEKKHKQSSINKSCDQDNCQSNEGLSDDGSIFDYSEYRESNPIQSTPLKSCNNTNKNKDATLLETSSLKDEENQKSSSIDNANEKNASVHIDKSLTPKVSVTSPKTEVHDPTGRSTPPNEKDYSPQIIVESIKKSHKKIKDQNRRSLFKAKILNSKDERTKPVGEPAALNSLNNNEIQDANPPLSNPTEKKDRANTPENLHSSRLLLNEFSSVKKSHKKEKQSKMISGFLKRKKYLNRDSTNTDDVANVSILSSCNDTSRDKVTNNSTDDQTSPISSPVKLSPKRKVFDDFVHDPSTNLYHDSFLSSHCPSSTCEFKIYTPIKKRKSPYSPTSSQAIDIEEPRCSTPMHTNAKFTDFSTPEKNDNATVSKSSPSTVESNLIPNNPNGASTPKNMSTLELLPNLDSIKVSHKKDKRASYLGKSLNYNGQGNIHPINIENPTNSDTSIRLESLNSSDSSFDHDIVKLDVESDVDADSKELRLNYSNPQPSTSKENINDCGIIGNTPSKKTPPNKMQVKSIIQLMQTTSIKRSHKKERNRRKHSARAKLLSTLDFNTSDDGSIFDESEKIDHGIVPENELIIKKQPLKKSNGTGDFKS